MNKVPLDAAFFLTLFSPLFLFFKLKFATDKINQ